MKIKTESLFYLDRNYEDFLLKFDTEIEYSHIINKNKGRAYVFVEHDAGREFVIPLKGEMKMHESNKNAQQFMIDLQYKKNKYARNNSGLMLHKAVPVDGEVIRKFDYYGLSYLKTLQKLPAKSIEICDKFAELLDIANQGKPICTYATDLNKLEKVHKGYKELLAAGYTPEELSGNSITIEQIHQYAKSLEGVDFDPKYVRLQKAEQGTNNKLKDKASQQAQTEAVATLDKEQPSMVKTPSHGTSMRVRSAMDSLSHKQKWIVDNIKSSSFAKRFDVLSKQVVTQDHASEDSQLHCLNILDYFAGQNDKDVIAIYQATTLGKNTDYKVVVQQLEKVRTIMTPVSDSETTQISNTILPLKEKDAGNKSRK